MSNLYLLFLGLFIIFISCDGSDRVHKTNKEILTENKLLDSFSENVKYIPESYTEVRTDTVLGNGFQIKIRYYSDMKNFVSHHIKKDSINYKNFYRDFNAAVVVLKNGEEIFNETINKAFLIKYDSAYIDTFDNEILNGVWVEDFKSLTANEASIAISFCKPNNDNCLFYNLLINEGNYRIEEIEQEN